jgi:hypothetical protein
MNRRSTNGDTDRALFTRIEFDGNFDVCWAGPHPFRPGLCFGSADGKLLFTDQDGDALAPAMVSCHSPEAVTGVARVETWLAVANRKEITFWPLPGSAELPDSLTVFPHGAHGITATASGFFVAPMGNTGVLAARPPSDAAGHAAGFAAEGVYVYRLVVLQPEPGREILACAVRSKGFAVGEFAPPPDGSHLRLASFHGLDIVDVCPSRPGENSVAVAALASDGRLILFRNALRDEVPVTLKYAEIEGSAYRVLGCRGHVFLLTSKALYMLARLAGRFSAGDPLEGTPTDVRVFPMDAVDISLCGDDWLLVVMANNAVRKFDIGRLHELTQRSLAAGGVSVSDSRPVAETVAHEWQTPIQTTRELAMSV